MDPFASTAPPGLASSGLGATLTGAVGPDNIRNLIALKERELHDINEFRLQTVEASLLEKDRETAELRAKLAKIKEDFQYNLKLFEERDAELERYDRVVAELSAASRDKDAELGTLRTQLTEARARLEGEKKAVTDLEAFYADQLKTLRESIESARRSRDEESRKWRAEAEAVRTEMESRLAAREEEWAAQRRELTEAADAAVSAMQRESRRRDEEAAAFVSEANARATAATRTADELREQVGMLTGTLEGVKASLHAAETSAATYRGEAEAARRERDAAQTAKHGLLEQYEKRMGELLSSLKQVEGAFKAQRDDYESRIAAMQTEAAASAQEYAAVMEARLQALVVRLTESDNAATAASAELASTKVAMDAANGRAAAAEDRARDVTNQWETAQGQWLAAKVAWEAEKAALESRVRSLEAAAATASGRAESTTTQADELRARVAALQSELAAVEKRAAAREASATLKHQEQMADVEASRHVLAHQLYAVLKAAGNHAAAEAISARFKLHGQGATAPPGTTTAPAASGLTSSTLLAGAGGGADVDASSVNRDVRESGAWLQSLLQSHDARTATMLAQLSDLEVERAGQREEVNRLREALAQARGQVAALEGQLTAGTFIRAATGALDASGVARLPRRPSAAGGASVSTHFTGDMGPASPPDAGMMGSALHTPAGAGGGHDVAALTRRCAELEEQTARFRAVIADMRSHMELLQAQTQAAEQRADQATTALSSGNGLPFSVVAEVAGLRSQIAVLTHSAAAAEAERDDVAAELVRCQDYVAVLTRRLDAAARGSATADDDGDRVELRHLRTHLSSLSQSHNAVRATLRTATAEVTTLRGRVAELEARAASAGGGGGGRGHHVTTTSTHDSTTTSTALSAGHRVGGGKGHHRSRSTSPMSSIPPTRVGAASVIMAPPTPSPELAAAKADVERLVREREQLLEISNQLRADLNKALSRSPPPAPGTSSGSPLGRPHPTPAATRPSSAPITAATPSTMGASGAPYNPARVAYLESTVAALGEQNLQMQREVQRLTAAANRQAAMIARSLSPPTRSMEGDHSHRSRRTSVTATRLDGYDLSDDADGVVMGGHMADTHPRGTSQLAREGGVDADYYVGRAGRRRSVTVPANHGTAAVEVTSMPAPPPQPPARSHSSARSGVARAIAGGGGADVMQDMTGAAGLVTGRSMGHSRRHSHTSASSILSGEGEGYDGTTAVASPSAATHHYPSRSEAGAATRRRVLTAGASGGKPIGTRTNPWTMPSGTSPSTAGSRALRVPTLVQAMEPGGRRGGGSGRAVTPTTFAALATGGTTVAAPSPATPGGTLGVAAATLARDKARAAAAGVAAKVRNYTKP